MFDLGGGARKKRPGRQRFLFCSFSYLITILIWLWRIFGITVFHVRHHFEKNHTLENDFDPEYPPEKEQQNDPITEVLEKGTNIFLLVLNKHVIIMYRPPTSLFCVYCLFLFKWNPYNNLIHIVQLFSIEHYFIVLHNQGLS